MFALVLLTPTTPKRDITWTLCDPEGFPASCSTCVHVPCIRKALCPVLLLVHPSPTVPGLNLLETEGRDGDQRAAVEPLLSSHQLQATNPAQMQSVLLSSPAGRSSYICIRHQNLAANKPRFIDSCSSIHSLGSVGPPWVDPKHVSILAFANEDKISRLHKMEGQPGGW